MVLAESDEEIPLIITVETDSSNDVSAASSTKLIEDDFESSDVSVASSTELKVDDFEPGDVSVVSSTKTKSRDVSVASSTELKVDDFEPGDVSVVSSTKTKSRDVSAASSTELKVDDFEPGDVSVMSSTETNGTESDQEIVEEMSLVSSNARNNTVSSDQQEETQPKPNEEDLSLGRQLEEMVPKPKEHPSIVSPSEKEIEKEIGSIKECNEGLSLVSPSEIEEVTKQRNSIAEPNDELDHGAMPPTDVTSHSPMSPSEDEVDVPLITFRTFILGPLTNIMVAAMHQLFSYRNKGIFFTKSLIQLMLLIVGKFLAAKLPKKNVRFPGTTIEFSMNPGPFQIKEHVLISILATSGMDSSQSLPVINVMRNFFHKKITFIPAFILVQSNELIGYGFAGIFYKFLIDSDHMPFPSLMPEVSFYRSLHEREKRLKGKISALQFLVMVSISAFAFSVVNNLFVTSLNTLSIPCWIFSKSLKAQILTSGSKGFGIGSISFDWTTISYYGSPIMFPLFSVVNKFLGFLLVAYIICPILYYRNSFLVKRFPVMGSGLYDREGNVYDIRRVLDDKLNLNPLAYKEYSKLYMTVFSLVGNGFAFAGTAATLVHFLLYYGRNAITSLARVLRKRDDFEEANKKRVPQWWFMLILVGALVLSIVNSLVYGHELELPVWTILLAVLLAALLLMPVTVVLATAGMSIPIALIAEISFGYVYPKHPITNLMFSAYSRSTKVNALTLITRFKLGHYLKIPPKAVFLVHVLGALMSSTTRIFIGWWATSTIKNICLPEEGNNWMCPVDSSAYSRSLLWGGIGPREVYIPNGQYRWFFLFFLIGLIGPIITYALSHRFPSKKWLNKINFPVFFSGPAVVPAMGAGDVWAFYLVSFSMNLWVQRKYKKWFTKYRFGLSNALDLGCGIFGLIALALGSKRLEWEGSGDPCPLASCPSDPNVLKKNCPVL